MSENNNNQTLLEKYFPKTWDDILLPSKIKKTLTEMQEQIGYRLLLYSSPGTGKSTSARLLVSDTNRFQSLYLSGSNDFKIDTLRGKVYTFASGMSVTNKRKVVIIDECENIRNDLQDAMKILLDTAKSVSFIFITNEVEKINDAIRSRCTSIEYNFNGDDKKEQVTNFVKFEKNICDKEGIEYTNEGLKELYIRLFPDFRHLLVILQQIKDSGSKVTEEYVKSLSENGKQNKELYDIILDRELGSKDVYEKLSKLKGKERDCLMSLGEPFFEYLNSLELFDKTLKAAVVVSKYSDSFVTSINKFVTFLSCIIELRSVFK